MAECEVCGREMTTAASCDLKRRNKFTPLEWEGELVTPVVWGQDLENNRELLEGGVVGGTTIAPLERCPDCGVQRGGYHHPGCDREQCPQCGGQILSCSCFDEDVDDEDLPDLSEI